MKNHIFVLPRLHYSKMLEGLSQEKKNQSAFIQINEPFRGKELFGGSNIPLQNDCLNVLNLWFDDAEEDLPLLNGDKLVLFDEEMAEKIYEFVMANRQAKMWMIHCTAGQCRSGAVGEVLSEYFQIPYNEFKFFNPQVKPNVLVKNLLRKKFFYHGSQ